MALICYMHLFSGTCIIHSDIFCAHFLKIPSKELKMYGIKEKEASNHFAKNGDTKSCNDIIGGAYRLRNFSSSTFIKASDSPHFKKSF